MGKISKYFVLFHLPWQILMIIIFVLSSIPSDDLPDLQFRAADKLAHLLLFGTLAVLVLRSFENSRSARLRSNAAILAITVTVVYGALDELHQLLVAGRSASLLDWIADCAGAILFVLIFRMIRRRFMMSSENREPG